MRYRYRAVLKATGNDFYWPMPKDWTPDHALFTSRWFWAQVKGLGKGGPECFTATVERRDDPGGLYVTDDALTLAMQDPPLVEAVR